MNTKEAIKAWNEAATCFESEDSKASANQCLLKVAELCAEEEDYKRAIQIYEKVAAASMDSNLARWSVKDYLYKATLCHFVMGAKAGDVKAVEEALNKYKETFPAFDGSRECKLMEQCLEAYNADSVDAFTEHVYNFDRIYKLDPWTGKILLTIKTILNDGVAPPPAAGGGGGGGDSSSPNPVDDGPDFS